MLRLSPKTVAVLRWIAVPPAVLAVWNAILPLQARLAFTAYGGVEAELLAGLISLVAGGSAVYLGALVAPSRRRLAVLLAVGLLSFDDMFFPIEEIAGIAGIAGIGLGAFLAWRRRSPKTIAVLRWIAFPAVVLLVYAAGFAGAQFAEESSVSWPVYALLGLGPALAVYLGSRVAPSRRRLAITLAAAALALRVYSDLGWLGPLVLGTSVVGIATGILLAWRHSRPEPRRVVLAAEGKSLRYKGTAPYQDLAVDRKTFFGRDRESRSLRSLVLAESLVVLFAKSGMGKTSLINAGLVEPLRERGYFPMVVRLADRERGPLGSLLDGVRAAARTAGVEVVGGDDTSAWRFFKTAEFWSPRDDLLRPVLIVDQFEELFTLHAPEPRREFIGQLAELVRGRAAAGREGVAEPTSDVGLAPGAPELKIVLSMREDFLADLEELAADIPGILHRRFRLEPLTPEGAREAIVGPARLADEAFDSVPFSYRDEAVEQIIGFLTKRRHGAGIVESDEVEPAQLQLVCQYLEELVQVRQPAGGAGADVEISEADLGDETQLQRVLEGFYDRTIAAIRSPWERRRVQRLCERRLISGSGRRLTEDEEEIEKRHKVSKKRLRELVNARLLRPEPRLGGLFYELSHDTLVEPVQQSRRKRVLRRRLQGVGLLGLLLIAAGGWWLTTKEEKAFREARRALPDPTEALEPLVVQKLDQIEPRVGRWSRDRRRFTEVMVALQDAMRHARDPDLKSRAQRLGRRLREDFLKAHNIEPPPSPAEDGQLNPRVPIEGGEFDMGSSEGVGEPDESPSHRVTVSPFEMQQHEVTNREYRRFDRSHRFEEGQELHPVVNVSWYDAMAYSVWLGGSLPTEAQWEFAARGREGRTFPWGEDEPTCERANYDPCGGGTLPVHSLPMGDTPEGVSYLAGNVWEWCRDWYGPYSARDRSDPPGPDEGLVRVLRGGAFGVVARALRGATRNGVPPQLRYDAVGFRVVWSSSGGLD